MNPNGNELPYKRQRRLEYESVSSAVLAAMNSSQPFIDDFSIADPVTCLQLEGGLFFPITFQQPSYALRGLRLLKGERERLLPH